MSDIPHNFRRDAFAGLAEDYLRYRLPYPRVMLDAFLAEAALPPEPRLLDLACGPGRVCLPIAARFAEVWAIDLEPDMVEAGRREAARRGIANVRWQVGRAEALQAPDGHFDLITVGEAFHRFDRPRVAALCLRWLKPGGALATLGCSSLMDGDAPWRQVLGEVVRAFIGEPARRLGAPNGATQMEEVADQEQDLRDAGFDPAVRRSFSTPHEWTLEELLGNLRSTSVLSRSALGERHAAFEAQLTEALLAYDPTGRYAETIDGGYTIAHKPAGLSTQRPPVHAS
jgi:ubiquinone/menaquinone biosynthesis C-methylase UbiE